MSFAKQAVRRVVESVTGQKTMNVVMRSTYAKPIFIRDPKTGIEEQGMRLHRTGEIVTVPADDVEFLDLLERKFCYLEGEPEPHGPPVCGAPISCELDPNGAEAETLGVLKQIASGLAKVGLQVVPKGGAA